MTAIVAVHSWRGGTGKSTVVARLAWVLAARGLRVGMVDVSLHAPGLHEALDIDVSSFRLCLWDYLRGVCEIEDARHDLSGLLPARGGRLFLVPARTDVEAISLYAASGRYDAGLLHEGFHRLIGVLELDALLIDTHAGADHEALHAIASSDVDILVTRVGSAEQRSAGLAASVSTSSAGPRRSRCWWSTWSRPARPGPVRPDRGRGVRPAGGHGAAPAAGTGRPAAGSRTC